MINFAVHQVRAGKTGASEDFEHMLGLLVRATSGGEACLVFANPGDWGIDVLVGDLNGSVSAWQAKYFVQGVGRSQQDQIRSSFASAVRAAAGHGYVLDRWVLCIPASMDGSATQWWQSWKARQEGSSRVAIELWDETRLRELLLRPESADVYRHYYAPSPASQKPRISLGMAPVMRFAPIGTHDPTSLGIHPALEIAGQPSCEAGLTVYAERAHDSKLRGLLADIRGPRMILATGGSSTGKTRACYEAIAARLPAWPLAHPRNPEELLWMLDSARPGTMRR